METVTRVAVNRVDAVIVPSEAVRSDAQRALGNGVPMTVVPEAAPPQFTSMVDQGRLKDTRLTYGLPDRYLLSVGSLEPGKNRGRILLALRILRDSGELDCALAIVGQPAWHYEAEVEMVSSLGLQDHVRFLGYVPDEDMPALYSGASALVFPSLYEGFGLPVIEAMACGTPVITSAVGATAEVGHGAAILVDPRDVDAIASAIRSVLTDERLRGDLQDRGLARSSEFSWERTAEETLAVYQAVMARS
jgi:glycosyltransferase involved in cell wall biosynthesis